jgi:hypothetical protein
LGHPVRVTCSQRSHLPTNSRRVKQWERLYGSRDVARYCGHVWVTRAWLCTGTSLTEQEFVSVNPEGEPELAGGTKLEGFDVDTGLFYFNTTTKAQMTTEGTRIARETADRRMQLPRNALLPDIFSPGPQACLLATNGARGYVREASISRPLCSCLPIELSTFDELCRNLFVQVA